MIRLRPHHLLCTQGYSGKGYSSGFVENMDRIVDRLRNVPGTRIDLVFSDDSLCSACPELKEYSGCRRCRSQDKVDRFDKKTVEYFGLEEKTYVYRELIEQIDQAVTGDMLEDICKGCSWYEISACRRNILAVSYLKRKVRPDL